MARLLVLPAFHVFYASLIAQMAWQHSSANQCMDETCPEEMELGQSVLQIRRHQSTQNTTVKGHLFGDDNNIDDGTGSDAASSEDAMESNMELIHGIPIYGYHSAFHAENEDDASLLATESDPVTWILGFSDKASDVDLSNFCNDLAGNATCTMTGHPDEKGLPIDTLRATKQELQEILAKHPEVSYGEADSFLYVIPEVPEDPIALLEAETEFRQETNRIPWGLDRIDERTRDSNRSYTPSPKKGSGVHVYVFDTGVRTTHSQFEGRAIPTLESCRGVLKVCSSTDTNCAADKDGHGTHCAGTVAGKTVGVAPKATVHAVQVCNCAAWGSRGCAFQDVISAIDWVLVHGAKPAVISMSLGRTGQRVHSTKVAIDKATSEGYVVVVAAGNDKRNACRHSPAYVPSAISVGSTTIDDEMSSFSNYGPCVDIFAPGSRVASAGHRSDTDLVLSSGTSMACPHVAGAAALALGQNPSLGAFNVASNLINKATPNIITNIPRYPSSPNKLLYVDDETPVVLPPPPTLTPTPIPTYFPTPVPTPPRPGKVKVYRHGDNWIASEMDACTLVNQRGGCWNLNQLGAGCNRNGDQCLKSGPYCEAGALYLPPGIKAESWILHWGSDWNNACHERWAHERGPTYTTAGQAKIFDTPRKPCAYKFSISDPQKYVC